MLTGKKFRLNQEMVAIETVGEKHVAMMLPADAVVTVLGGPRANDIRMVDVFWRDRTLIMFADDIVIRCEEIQT
jgi:hypothetical protein